MSRISQSQLESYLWGAAEHLRGSIDAGDYKQFIFPLLFLKRLCDVHDEETAQALRASGGDAEFASFAENHRFQVPAEAHWKEVRKETRNVGQAIQRAMRAIESANKDKLFGIFGDAQWSNKDRLSDETMRELVEHFSSLELTIDNLPEDELGNGYEFLIKKFADDSGHTAAEFYTNRTVVHLMTEMLDVQPGESVYDPTCGSGGMLMSCVAHLRKQVKEWRNVRLFGQERNLMTSSIARMNCFLHGIEDFRIERGDTLAEPKLVEGDKLMQFDVVLANPPYSIKQWDREAFRSDPWGRNLFGVPPQGRADYAFQQHINKSLKPKTGRCAVLWPHGVLFRQEEEEIRSKLIEADLIECVIGLGPNLFYNSPMEACVLICRSQKSKARKGKVLFINAINEVTRERAQSFLTSEHLQRIVKAYQDFKEESGFTRVATLEEIRSKKGNLSIALYVEAETKAQCEESSEAAASSLPAALSGWINSSHDVLSSLIELEGSSVQKTHIKLNKPTANPSWATLPMFDRTSWKRMTFGEFVENIGDRVEPKDAQEEIYVGLEHLDPHCLHIRRWGKGSDVTGGKLRFRKGDIIFGKRRAYQRKLAVTEFGGICSAHAMVIRARPDKVLPEFLPFLMMSDRFMNRAVEISVGSLSPTINWTTLKLETFDLPPLDQQRRISDVLLCLNASFEFIEHLRQSTLRLYDAKVNALLFDNNNPATSIGENAEINRNSLSEKTPDDFEFFYVDIASVSRKKIGELTTYKFKDAPGRARRCVTQGDILVSTVRPNLQSFARVDKHSTSLIASTGFAVISPHDKVRGDLIFHAIFSPHFSAYCRSKVTGTNYPTIGKADVEKFSFNLPTAPASQAQAAICLNQLDHILFLLEQTSDKQKRVTSSLTNLFV